MPPPSPPPPSPPPPLSPPPTPPSPPPSPPPSHPPLVMAWKWPAEHNVDCKDYHPRIGGGKQEVGGWSSEYNLAKACDSSGDGHDVFLTRNGYGVNGADYVDFIFTFDDANTWCSGYRQFGHSSHWGGTGNFAKDIEIYASDANFGPWTKVATDSHSTWHNANRNTFTDDGTTTEWTPTAPSKYLKVRTLTNHGFTGYGGRFSSLWRLPSRPQPDRVASCGVCGRSPTRTLRREKRGGEGGRHAGNGVGDRNGNAPTTGAAAAMVGRSMASQGQWKRSPQKPQAADHRRRTERGRDGVGRGREGWVEGARSVGRGDTFTWPKRKGPRADSLLYGKLFVLSMSWCLLVSVSLAFTPLHRWYALFLVEGLSTYSLTLPKTTCLPSIDPRHPGWSKAMEQPWNERLWHRLTAAPFAATVCQSGVGAPLERVERPRPEASQPRRPRQQAMTPPGRASL
eukprot:scaffold23794_cov44-Phaeocystis_antarctica.AAC.1